MRGKTFLAALISLLLFGLVISINPIAFANKHDVDLSVSSFEGNPSSVTENGLIEYRIRISNSPLYQPANTISVAVQQVWDDNSLPAGAILSGSGHRWTCTASGASANCVHTGSLPAGGTSDTLLLIARAPASGNARLLRTTATVSVGPDYLDKDSSNNSKSILTTVKPGADLTVDSADEPDPVTAGNTVRYLVTVSNNSNVIANGVKLTNEISSGTITFISGTGWDCSITSSTTASCDLATVPADGAANVVDMHVLTNYSSSDYGLTNTAKVTSVTGDTNPNNNTSVESTTVQNGDGDTATGYISPDGGSVSTCSPAQTTPTDNTCATATFPAGPGGIATIIEKAQLTLCATPPGCSGNSADIIIPDGYFTVPVVVTMRVDYSDATNMNDLTRKMYEQKLTAGQQVETVTLPACAGVPRVTCLRGFQRETGTLTPDLLGFIEMYSGDPIFQIGDGTGVD